MPTLQEIEDSIAQMGQKYVTRPIDNSINQNIDQPIQNKLAALHQASANAQAAQSQVVPQNFVAPPPQQTPVMGTAGSPGSNPYPSGTPMNFNDMDARTQAMHQMYPDQQADPDADERHAAQDQALAPQPRQFPHIQAKIKSGQPVTKDDIRQTISPTEALSPDDEDAVNKQLQSKDDEDED
jgi:hypothetical protein